MIDTLFSKEKSQNHRKVEPQGEKVRRASNIIPVSMMLVFGTAAYAAGIPVTPETYTRAETDIAFADTQRRAGGKINTNAFVREPTLLNDQPVIRMNRDTLYGGVVIDTEGGATVTVPKA